MYKTIQITNAFAVLITFSSFLFANQKNEYIGVGLVLTKSESFYPIVVSVAENSPASGKIFIGDLIIAICIPNGNNIFIDTLHYELKELISFMDTVVLNNDNDILLRIQRQHEKSEMLLKRNAIPLDSFQSEFDVLSTNKYILTTVYYNTDNVVKSLVETSCLYLSLYSSHLYNADFFKSLKVNTKTEFYASCFTNDIVNKYDNVANALNRYLNTKRINDETVFHNETTFYHDTSLVSYSTLNKMSDKWLFYNFNGINTHESVTNVTNCVVEKVIEIVVTGE